MLENQVTITTARIYAQLHSSNCERSATIGGSNKAVMALFLHEFSYANALRCCHVCMLPLYTRHTRPLR